jgi:pantoate--beta-alanine ligase
MKTVTTIAEIRNQLADWRERGERIAFVPTMGNLHAGHLQLLKKARHLAPRTVVSIFVNPLQFGPSEDYQSYPRSLEADSVQLAAEGLDVLFAPKVGEMYPDGTESMSRCSEKRITSSCW